MTAFAFALLCGFLVTASIRMFLWLANKIRYPHANRIKLYQEPPLTWRLRYVLGFIHDFLWFAVGSITSAYGPEIKGLIDSIVRHV